MKKSIIAAFWITMLSGCSDAAIERVQSVGYGGTTIGQAIEGHKMVDDVSWSSEEDSQGRTYVTVQIEGERTAVLAILEKYFDSEARRLERSGSDYFTARYAIAKRVLRDKLKSVRAEVRLQVFENDAVPIQYESGKTILVYDGQEVVRVFREGPFSQMLDGSFIPNIIVAAELAFDEAKEIHRASGK